jgi:hypothetical protein
VRTFGRAEWLEAKRAWEEGDFGVEWIKIRELAAERGMIYPPDGSKWDDREDETPSQRAIVYRAMEDTPHTLKSAIASSYSWSQVVRKVITDMETRREDADWTENRDAFRRETEPTPKQATASLAAIMSRIADSTGVVVLSGGGGQAKALTDVGTPGSAGPTRETGRSSPSSPTSGPSVSERTAQTTPDGQGIEEGGRNGDVRA